METALPSETSVPYHITTGCHNPEGHDKYEYFTLNMETALPSETLVPYDITTGCHNPEGHKYEYFTLNMETTLPSETSLSYHITTPREVLIILDGRKRSGSTDGVDGD